MHLTLNNFGVNSKKTLYIKKYISLFFFNKMYFLQVGAWRSWCRNDRTIISVAFYNIHLYIKLGNEHVKTSYYWVRMHSVDMYANFFLATTELLRDSFLRGRGCCSKKNRIVFISIIMFDETYNKQFWYNTQIKEKKYLLSRI